MKVRSRVVLASSVAAVFSCVVSVAQALWINETMRKVYPSSSRQVREGRFPSRFAIVQDRDGTDYTLVEERFDACPGMQGFLPPLSKTITALLYFADYDKDEFEPVLDERMIVFTYAALDPTGMPENYVASEDYRILLSRFLYVYTAGAPTGIAQRYIEFVLSEAGQSIVEGVGYYPLPREGAAAAVAAPEAAAAPAEPAAAEPAAAPAAAVPAAAAPAAP